MVLSPVMGGVVHYHLVDEIEESWGEMVSATSDMEEGVHHTHTHTHTHTHARAHTNNYAALDNSTM